MPEAVRSARLNELGPEAQVYGGLSYLIGIE